MTTGPGGVAGHMGIINRDDPHWATPPDLFANLNAEFNFNDDPCPLGGSGGIDREWGTRTFVNPPYGIGLRRWFQKGIMEWRKGKLIVFLIYAKTDTKWFHDFCYKKATEIRFIKGRLHYIHKSGKTGSAPYPSMIVIYRPAPAHLKRRRNKK